MRETQTKPPSAFKRLLKGLAAWIAAFLITAILATIASAQFVAEGLANAGAAVPLSERVFMAGKDVTGLGPLYAVFIALAFAIAFFTAFLLARKVPTQRTLIYTVAGATAMAVMLLAMERVFFGIPVIAGARSGLGFAVQVLCGAAGGYVFAYFTRGKPVRETLAPDDILPV